MQTEGSIAAEEHIIKTKDTFLFHDVVTNITALFISDMNQM